ncbi:MAG: hypothetical protein K8W52_36540 [Deltaproteobacteria bacterium]|nr:hypothetical protein [Deltaproteobacteria bacterium]
MLDLVLIDARGTDLASDARHLREAFWVSPCGELVAYPTETAIVILAITDAGFVEQRRVPLPPGCALRHLGRGFSQRAEGIQCGALGPGGAMIALATHAQVLIEAGGDWQALSLSASQGELEAGVIDDEDARWLGEPDAIGFDRAGGLWLAATHIEGLERLTRIDPAQAAIVATADLGEGGGYPDPVHVALVPGAHGVGVTIACGQDGCEVSDVMFVDGAIAVVPAVPFGAAPVNHLGWAPDGARVIATWERLIRVAADGPTRFADAPGGRDLAGVVTGDAIALPAEPGMVALFDAETLAPRGVASARGTILHAVRGGLLIAGWGLDWGQLWLYRVADR